MDAIVTSRSIAPRDPDERQPLGILPSRGFWLRVHEHLPRVEVVLYAGTFGIGFFVAGFFTDAIAERLGGGFWIEVAVTAAIAVPVARLCQGLLERWFRSKARRRMLSEPRWKLVADRPAVPEKVGEDPPQPGDDSSERP